MTDNHQPPNERQVAENSGLDESERELFLQAVKQTAAPEHSERGQMVTGKLTGYSGEYAVVDLGGKSEGFIASEELRDEKGELPQPGTTIEACVISSGSEGLFLSRRLAKGIRDREHLAEAFKNRLPVDGRVLATRKGGFDVEVAGLRAFCPISQIELKYCEDPAVHVGKKYAFLITKYETSGRRVDLVLSRRAILEVEQKRRAEELRRSLKVGDIVNGTVKSTHNFGAFIDLGGLDGFLPASEISYQRNADPRALLKAGEEVHVQVLSIEANDKITLSLKRLETDPWQEVAERFPPGSRVKGRVSKIEPFGAFVELEPGVEGLVHISKLNTPNRVNHPNQVLEVGHEITVEVLGIDAEQRRISLARVPQDGEFGALPLVGDVVEGTVESIANFGVFVQLGPGRKGLIPNVELGTPRGSDARQHFTPGSKVKVKVLEVAEGGKRIRLSRRAALEEEERSQVDQYLEKAQAKESFGTLGDLLKNQLK